MPLRLALLALALSVALSAQSPSLYSAEERKFLGSVNANRFDPNSIANPYGAYGSRYSSNSVNNPFGQYGSPYSSSSARNRFAPSLQAPKVIAPNGDYLGDFSANKYSPNSVSNPYGRFGSRYSPSSIKNPFSPDGSRYAPSGARSPYGLGRQRSRIGVRTTTRSRR